MKKEILKQVRSNYEKLEIKPSNDLWDRIEAELDEVPDSSFKKTIHWWKYAAVVLLLISFGSVFYFNSSQPENTTLMTNNEDVIKDREPIEIDDSAAEQPQKITMERISDQKHIPSIIKSTNTAQIPEENFKINKGFAQEESKIIAKEDIINIPAINRNVAEKPIIAAVKKADYIKADELLLGREFDKTRVENQNEHRKFGVLDMSKIKIKSPNSFRIFGVTVFSDSLETK